MNKLIGLTVATAASLWATGLARAQTAAPQAGQAMQSAQRVVEDIRDVRGPIAEAAPWWHGLGIVALVVLGAMIIVISARMIVLWMRRPKTPAEIALARIAHAEAAVGETGPKAFGYEVSETLRAYIEVRFTVHAPTQTTEELLDELAEDPNSPLAEHRTHLFNLLSLTDLVKYAEAGLGESEVRAVAEAARAFVEASRDKPAGRQNTFDLKRGGAQ